METKKLIGLIALVGLLAGCSNGGGSGGSAIAPANSLSTIAAQDTTQESDPINDAAQLIQDIEALFGDVTAEPVDVMDGETATDVITRLGG